MALNWHFKNSAAANKNHLQGAGGEMAQWSRVTVEYPGLTAAPTVTHICLAVTSVSGDLTPVSALQ